VLLIKNAHPRTSNAAFYVKLVRRGGRWQVYLR
jgi:hypothetical protein